MNSVIQSLHDRKSVRAYTGQPITAEEKKLILEAAAQAPTAGNQQLYTVLDITDPDVTHRLNLLCGDQPFIEQAAMVLVFVADPVKWYNAYAYAGCEPRPLGLGDLLLSVSDANIAAQNTVVAAESLGIGSCYIGDIMENYEQQRELLNLPNYVMPVGMLIFGYPTQQQMDRPKPERVEMKFIVHENGYAPMGDAQLEEMWTPRAGEKGYNAWMQAFCNRKYNSNFSREMTRSVEKYLEQFQ